MMQLQKDGMFVIKDYAMMVHEAMVMEMETRRLREKGISRR